MVSLFFGGCLAQLISQAVWGLISLVELAESALELLESEVRRLRNGANEAAIDLRLLMRQLLELGGLLRGLAVETRRAEEASGRERLVADQAVALLEAGLGDVEISRLEWLLHGLVLLGLYEAGLLEEHVGGGG